MNESERFVYLKQNLSEILFDVLIDKRISRFTHAKAKLYQSVCWQSYTFIDIIANGNLDFPGQLADEAASAIFAEIMPTPEPSPLPDFEEALGKLAEWNAEQKVKRAKERDYEHDNH